MHPPLLYRGLVAAAARAAPLAAPWWPALADGLRDRRAALETFLRWGATGRDPARPLLLLHAASAGELRQVEPVLRRLRAAHPRWQCALTWFSPSTRAVADELPVDIHGPLPWDREADVEPFLRALRPSVLVYAKLDLWPVLTLSAAALGIPVALIAATVRQRSGRLRWPARAILERGYRALTRVEAVSADDADRLIRLGVLPDRVSVSGDPRYDAVLERVAGRATGAGHPTTMVAGSTWPEDEEHLLQAFRAIHADQPLARLVIVPHRPTPDHLARVRQRAAALGLPALVPAEQAAPTDPLVLVETVGDLAFRYGEGSMAYVGGGFRDGGLHSVLEPAALSLPVIAGPDARDRPEARALEAAEGLVRLPRQRGAAVLEAWWSDWLVDADWRNRAGAAARRVVQTGAGAADRLATAVTELVG